MLEEKRKEDHRSIKTSFKAPLQRLYLNMIEEALLVVANVVIANFLSSGSTVRLQTLNGVHLQVAAFSVLRAALASKVHHIQVAAKERRHLQSIEKGRHLGNVWS